MFCFETVCSDLGMPIANEKTVGPTTVLTSLETRDPMGLNALT